MNDKKAEIKINMNKTEETKNKSGTSDVSALIQKNAQLESELAEMKELIKQIITNQNISNSPPENDAVLTVDNESDYSDEVPTIPPNKLINVTSLFYGGMTLRGSNDKKIRFERFGVTRIISFEDITYICTNHNRLAEEGAFIIQSKDAVKALYLERAYERILDKKKIENLIDLPHEKIDDIVRNLTDIQKNTIENVIIQGLVDGNNKFNNHTKLEIIERHCKKNLRAIAQERSSGK